MFSDAFHVLLFTRKLFERLQMLRRRIVFVLIAHVLCAVFEMTRFVVNEIVFWIMYVAGCFVSVLCRWQRMTVRP